MVTQYNRLAGQFVRLMAADKLFQGHLDGGIIASRPPRGVIALPPPKVFASLQEAAASQPLLDSWEQKRFLSGRETRGNLSCPGGEADCTSGRLILHTVLCVGLKCPPAPLTVRINDGTRKPLRVIVGKLPSAARWFAQEQIRRG